MRATAAVRTESMLRAADPAGDLGRRLGQRWLWREGGASEQNRAGRASARTVEAGGGAGVAQVLTGSPRRGRHPWSGGCRLAGWRAGRSRELNAAAAAWERHGIAAAPARGPATIAQPPVLEFPEGQPTRHCDLRLSAAAARSVEPARPPTADAPANEACCVTPSPCLLSRARSGRPPPSACDAKAHSRRDAFQKYFVANIAPAPWAPPEHPVRT